MKNFKGLGVFWLLVLVSLKVQAEEESTLRESAKHLYTVEAKSRLTNSFNRKVLICNYLL